MTATKTDLKKLIGDTRSVKAAEKLINRKLTTQEKVDLGLITINKQPKQYNAENPNREKQKRLYNQIKNIEQDIDTLTKESKNVRSIQERMKFTKNIINKYNEINKLQQNIFNLGKKKNTDYGISQLFRNESERNNAVARARQARREEQHDIFTSPKRLFGTDEYQIIMDGEMEHFNHRTFESDWHIENAGQNVEQSINDLIQRIRDKYEELGRDRYNNALCVLTIRAPNGNQRQTARGLFDNLDIAWIIDMVEFLMDQSGRTDFLLDEMDFHITVFIPAEGRGRKTNQVLNADFSSVIIPISNDDTICLARAIVVGLADKNLLHIFRGKFTLEELKAINFRKKLQTNIHLGEATEDEIHQIKNHPKYKLQTILASALHRLAQVEIKQDGNDLTDVEIFADYLKINIIVYDYIKKKRINEVYGSQSKILETNSR